MKLFKRSERPAVKSAVPNGNVFALHGPTHAVWSPRDLTSMTRNGFLKNPVGFRAVKLISETAANVPLTLFGIDQDYDRHPVLQLLRQPNQWMSGASFLEVIYCHLILNGNAYLQGFGEEGELPGSLYFLRPDRMQVVVGKDGWPIAYNYRVGNKNTRIAIDMNRPEILHIKTIHPTDDHYGLSPLHAAAVAIDVHNAASSWSKALLDNAARPSGAIVYKGADGNGQLTNAQYTRLAEEIENNHQGARNAGRPMLLEGGLDWKPMGFSPSDMEFQKTKESAAREIALAFGVPPMILGLPGDNTYANYQEANRAFYRLTVLPLVAKVMESIGNWLRHWDGAHIDIRPDFDKVSALAGERDAHWNRIANAPFLSDDEKRQLLGFHSEKEPS